VKVVPRLPTLPRFLGRIFHGQIKTGVLVSPVVLGIASSMDVFAGLSNIGVAFILFIVGLHLNPKIIRDVGKVSLITGAGQVLFTSVIGFLICLLLGFSVIVSVYVSIAITFSSTIIIMKLLSDKSELETLYGRIAVGFLIVQDLIAMLFLLIISSISTETDVLTLVLTTLGKLVVLVGGLFLIGYYLLPKLTRNIAKNQELILLFSIAWCFAISIAFFALGFSIEIGALLAGATLAVSPYRYEISSKMKPLRDFFLILFFISLGSQMVFSDVTKYIVPIIILSIFILIGNPIIVMFLMGALKYTKRNGFLAGLTVAQISEFSLILIALGVRVGHLETEVLSFVTVIGLITIAGSSYMIMYANKLYPHISKYISFFEYKGKKVDEHAHIKNNKINVILFGYNRIGFDLLESLKKSKKKFMVVDFNPEVIANLSKEKISCKYGDANDVELLNDFDFTKIKMTISTIPDPSTNLLLINYIREINKKCIIIVVAHSIENSVEMYKAGATYVLLPHFLGGKYVGTMIENYGFRSRKFVKEQLNELNDHLKKKVVEDGHASLKGVHTKKVKNGK